MGPVAGLAVLVPSRSRARISRPLSLFFEVSRIGGVLGSAGPHLSAAHQGALVSLFADNGRGTGEMLGPAVFLLHRRERSRGAPVCGPALPTREPVGRSGGESFAAARPTTGRAPDARCRTGAPRVAHGEGRCVADADASTRARSARRRTDACRGRRAGSSARALHARTAARSWPRASCDRRCSMQREMPQKGTPSREFSIFAEVAFGTCATRQVSTCSL